jgi:hypothetical protein
MTEKQKTISSWLADAGAEGGHHLALGEDGHCTISFGEGLQCLVEVPGEPESDIVFLYCPLVALPADLGEQNALLRQLLEWNMFGIATAGAHLSLDPRSETVVLGFAADPDMLDAEMFKQALGDLLDTAVAIHGKLGETVSSPDGLPTISPFNRA